MADVRGDIQHLAQRRMSRGDVRSQWWSSPLQRGETHNRANVQKLALWGLWQSHGPICSVFIHLLVSWLTYLYCAFQPSILLVNQDHHLCWAPSSVHLENKPPDVTHASVPSVYISWWKPYEFGLWLFVTMVLGEQQHKKDLTGIYPAHAGVVIMQECSRYRMLLLCWCILCSITSGLAQLSRWHRHPCFFASEGQSPSCVCSRAWICGSGALRMCDRLPERGAIPKDSGSNRVIYYTVLLFLPPFLLPPSQSLSFSLPLPLHQHFMRTNEK